MDRFAELPPHEFAQVELIRLMLLEYYIEWLQAGTPLDDIPNILTNLLEKLQPLGNGVSILDFINDVDMIVRDVRLAAIFEWYKDKRAKILSEYGTPLIREAYMIASKQLGGDTAAAALVVYSAIQLRPPTCIIRVKELVSGYSERTERESDGIQG